MWRVSFSKFSDSSDLSKDDIKTLDSEIINYGVMHQQGLKWTVFTHCRRFKGIKINSQLRSCKFCCMGCYAEPLIFGRTVEKLGLGSGILWVMANWCCISCFISRTLIRGKVRASNRIPGSGCGGE